MRKYINFSPVIKHPAAEYFGKIFPGKHFSGISFHTPRHTKFARNNEQDRMVGMPGAVPGVPQQNPNLLPQVRPLQIGNQPWAFGTQFNLEPPRLPLPADWKNGINDVNNYLNNAVKDLQVHKDTINAVLSLNQQLTQDIAGQQLSPSQLAGKFLSVIGRNVDMLARLPIGQLDAKQINAPEGWGSIYALTVTNQLSPQQFKGLLDGYRALAKFANGGKLSPQEMASLRFVAATTVMLTPVQLGPSMAVVMNLPAYMILRLLNSPNPEYKQYARQVIQANLTILEAINQRQAAR